MSTDLQKLKGLSTHFEDRKSRALLRLEAEKRQGWFFGIVGLKIELSSFDFSDRAIVLEEVDEPPGEVELAKALARPELFSAVARYSHGIRHQLCILESASDDQQACFNMAWWVISLIRVRTCTDFLVPVASSHSWSVIAGLEPNSCDVQFIEDVPKAKKLGTPTSVSSFDLAWVSDHLLTFADLLEVQSFRLAVECLTTHHQQTNDRMMAAILWSGIESLFSIQTELTFRISAFIAALLESPGVGRRDLYGRVKKLYGVRSKAVHGAKLTAQQLHEHVVEVRELLSRLLCLAVEQGKVFTEQQVENALFGVQELDPPGSQCENQNYRMHGL